MTKKRVLEGTLIILLIPIFLTSYGTVNEVPELWWSGLMMLAVGGVIPPVTRFVYEEEEDGGGDEADAEQE